MIKNKRLIFFSPEGPSQEPSTLPNLNERPEALELEMQNAEALQRGLEENVKNKDEISYKIGDEINNPTWKMSDGVVYTENGKFSVVDPEKFLNDEFFKSQAEHHDVCTVQINGVSHLLLASKGKIKHVLRKLS